MDHLQKELKGGWEGVAVFYWTASRQFCSNRSPTAGWPFRMPGCDHFGFDVRASPSCLLRP
jgi:hypothetical protein